MFGNTRWKDHTSSEFIKKKASALNYRLVSRKPRCPDARMMHVLHFIFVSQEVSSAMDLLACQLLC